MTKEQACQELYEWLKENEATVSSPGLYILTLIQYLYHDNDTPAMALAMLKNGSYGDVNYDPANVS
jgi:hypothetical protein